MRRMISCILMVMLGFMFLVDSSYATQYETYFKGKTIRIVVGAAPGGGLDAYSRLFARHMTKYIPGKPTIIVQNMPGAGGLVAANHVYSVAKPDGLTFGNWQGGNILGQVLGRPGIEFDARKIEWIGAPMRFTTVGIFSKASGITSMDKLVNAKKRVQIGVMGPGSNTYDVPKILEVALGLPINLVPGYKGVAEIRLALEAGEVDGCFASWEGNKAIWRKSLDSGNAFIVVQGAQKAVFDLQNIPLSISYAKTEEARDLIQAGIHDQNVINRVYSLPPGTSKELVQIFRKAFQDTMKDSEFRADAEKSQQDMNLVTGEELEEIVSRLFKLNPGVIAKLKLILK